MNRKRAQSIETSNQRESPENSRRRLSQPPSFVVTEFHSNEKIIYEVRRLTREYQLASFERSKNMVGQLGMSFKESELTIKKQEIGLLIDELKRRFLSLNQLARNVEGAIQVLGGAYYDYLQLIKQTNVRYEMQLHGTIKEFEEVYLQLKCC